MYFCSVTTDATYMARCLQLAKNGLGTTYPNPMVGSVVVHDDRIIGEGWHHSAGQPHAEVNAINSVLDSKLLQDATIYVNLEPCSHFGKTPPCANLIIEKKIKKVVIGATDPNREVAGRGIRRLRQAGCEVITGVLEAESMSLNKRFFTFHQKKRPYVILKWAQTSDGFLAPASKEDQKPVWITTLESRQWVHQMRAKEQAILVGTQTVLDDNPSLTARQWNGPSPVRIVLDRTLKIPEVASVYDQRVPTIFISEKEGEARKNVSFESIDFSNDVAEQVCDLIYKNHFQSVIVEGGARTLQTFLDEGLWDEAWVFVGVASFGEGLKAPRLEAECISEETINTDLLKYYKNTTS